MKPDPNSLSSPPSLPSMTTLMRSPYLRLCLFLIAAAVLATVWFYPQLPARIPVHWDANGNINGKGPRVLIWLFGPGAMSLVLALAPLLPRISPQRYDLRTFLPTFYYFILLLTGCLAYVFTLSLYAALNGAVSMQHAVPAGLFLLLILIGNPLGKVRRNFFIGVRTPWTLASERVWHATHRLTARLMVACGLLGLVAVATNAAHQVVALLAFGWAIVAVVFSLLYYKRLEKSGDLDVQQP